MLRFLVWKITLLYLFKWCELKAEWVRTCSLSKDTEEKSPILLNSYLCLESLLWTCWVLKSLVQLLNILGKGKISNEVFAKEHYGFWMETLSNTLNLLYGQSVIEHPFSTCTYLACSLHFPPVSFYFYFLFSCWFVCLFFNLKLKIFKGKELRNLWDETLWKKKTKTT